MMRASSWRVALPLTLLIVLGLFALFFDTARSMVVIWNSAETFAHGYIIVPISLWLIWQQRAVLARRHARPAGWGLLALGGVVFLWLLGNLSGAQVVMQYAMVAMIPAAVWSLWGWATMRPILFPLMFMLLAVPFGEALIDPLMNLTADFTVAALQMTGIPVFREGNTITISSGVWSVVEACSGVRYLIASVTLGIIYAYLTYRSIQRQLAFVLASIIVPIVANGVRAYMIVMIGHLSNMKYAVGIDHLIYGWLFFGVVMLLLFWVGGFWREDAPSLAATQHAPDNSPPPPAGRLLAFTLAVFVIAGAGPAYSALVARTMAKQAPVQLSLPEISGWREIREFTDWRPTFKMPSAEQTRFLSQGEQQAGIYIGYYRNQSQQAELISYGNVLALPEGKRWRRLSESTLHIHDLDMQQNHLAHDQQRLLAWYWYWVGDHFTSNSYEAKAYLALNRLLMRPDDSAVVVVFAPYTGRADPAATTLRQLVQDALPAIRQQLHEAQQP